MNILEKIGFKKRTHVGISISANNFIELVCIDKTAKAVVKYSSDNIKYNNSIREIVDYDELAEVVERLFEDVGLNPRECSVTLSLPNVHFGITTLDNNTDKSFIIENIQSDLEDLYIFKRNEAALSYSILDNCMTKGQKNIVFSAIQTKVVARILEMFDKMGVELTRIDTSYSCMFKAIQFCDRFNKYVLPDEKTSIILITPNSCSAFFMSGPIVADVIEEPLAVKSFSSEEVYSAVSKLATNSILKNSPKSLLIISETDEVDSEIVSQRLDFTGEVDCINKGINNSDQFIEVYGLGSDIDSNMVAYMTIEAIGTAASDFDEYPLDINFIPSERVQKNVVQVGAYEIVLNNYLIFVAAIAIVITTVLSLSVNTLCSIGMNIKRNANESMQQDIGRFNKTIEANSNQSKVDILPVMTKIVNQNKSVIDAFLALSTDIPDSVYIQKFVAVSNGGIGILGEAMSSESVQSFVDNLKDKNLELMLTKLSVNSKNEGLSSKIPDGYTFEIKTPNKNVSLEDDQTSSSVKSVVSPEKDNQSGASSNNSLLPPPSPII